MIYIITSTKVDTSETEILKVLDDRLEAVNYLYEHVAKIGKEHTLVENSMYEYTRTFGYLFRSKTLDKIYKIHEYGEPDELLYTDDCSECDEMSIDTDTIKADDLA